MWNGHYYGDWAPWGGLVMTIVMVAFWVFVALAVFWLVRRSLGRPSGTGVEAPERPRDVLDRRFASGEIDKEEYRARLRVLTEARAP